VEQTESALADGTSFVTSPIYILAGKPLPFHGINNLNYCSFDSFDVDYLNFAVQ
jgi:hypothetical protein